MARYIKHKRKKREDGTLKTRTVTISTNRQAEEYLESRLAGMGMDDAINEAESILDKANTPPAGRKDRSGRAADEKTKEKAYYMPASPDQMRLHSFEYVWFSASR